MTHQHHKKDSGAVERRCIATGATAPKAGMIRFVVGPDGWLVPDVLQKLPGRGIWVSADRAALQKAVKKGLFARAAKQPVTLPDDLIGLTEAALAKRLIELISLARKAGLAVTGYEKVKSWLISERARVLLQARDGSERGKSRLRAPGGPDGFIGILTGQELGLAFGRENVIHGALAAGGLTKRVVEEAARLEGLRLDVGGNATKRGLKTK